MEERCGSCTRCLEACPTRAIPEARVVDARRCISYLTIEHDGPVEASLRESIGSWFLGCDVCQDVCPFNRTHATPGLLARDLAPHPRWSEHDAGSVLSMSEEAFDAFSLGSPVRRPGREGAARNAAYVLGNRGDRRHLPVLREASTRDASEVVRDAARWAIARIERRDDG
jgi:epoxyqueuosine reductase